MATVLAPSRADRAFERLYRRYVADVYRYVLAVLQNEADAEDATQTAFLQAYRAYERGERAERPLNWLIAIAHNVCRQRFRESARRPRLVELEDDVADRPGDDEAPNAEEIRRALGFLAFNQRAALVMRELQGRSYSEIGRILGLSTSAVETLLFRARRALREQLEGGLTCGDAELALSKRADGELPLSERGPLRAHLRECAECAALERGSRFRSRAIKGLGTVPLPSSLGSFFGGGAVGTGAGVSAKAAAVVVAALVGGGVAGDAIKQSTPGIDDPAAGAASRPALDQQRPETSRTAVPSAVRVERASATRRPPPARLPQTRAADAPATVATPVSPAAPQDETAPPAPQSGAAPPEQAPTDGPVPTAPTVPSLPVSAPKAPTPPATPTLPQPRLPELPSLPTPPPLPLDVPTSPPLPQTTVPQLPKAPDLNLPRVELPKVSVTPTEPRPGP